LGLGVLRGRQSGWKVAMGLAPEMGSGKLAIIKKKIEDVRDVETG